MRRSTWAEWGGKPEGSSLPRPLLDREWLPYVLQHDPQQIFCQAQRRAFLIRYWTGSPRISSEHPAFKDPFLIDNLLHGPQASKTDKVE
ncbi:MAG TPA: hypothetical protein VG273_28915 [Bryobacteraceae bacterium]|nr:hypothetical protein [Bryobacteraceae bacterium]